MRISFLIVTLLCLFAAAHADQALVLVSSDCEYQIVSMGGRNMSLIKIVEGERPQKNDLLQGSFLPGSFNRLVNKRTGATLNVWLEQPASASQTLSQHSAYCSK